MMAGEEEVEQLEHFLRVGLKAQQQYGDYAGLVGLLHDLVEDGWTTRGRLEQAGFPQIVVDAVMELTRTDEPETYVRYIENIASGSLLARNVKIIDIYDNLSRKPKHPEHEARYRAALEVLL